MFQTRIALVALLLSPAIAYQRDISTASPGDIASAADSLGQPRSALAEYNLDDAVALHGYDPVAYFPEGGATPKPVQAKFSLRYDGVLYAFANRKNLETFKADPAKYEPVYGGWCAWAIVRGGKVDADPENFIIQNGQLMAFYRNAVVDTRDKWNEGDTAKLEVDADAEWLDISGEKTTLASR